MFNQLRQELTINILFVSVFLIVVLISFCFICRIKMEQLISQSMSIYMNESTNFIKNDEENPRLFISTIEVNTYEQVSTLINDNIFKYFNMIYADDSFSTYQIDNILSQIIEISDHTSTIEIGERYYKFRKQNTENDKIKILVLDISNRLIDFKRITYNLLGIAAISIILIYFLAKLIIDRSIKSLELIHKRHMEFISEISHEIKNPITIAITNLAVIRSHKEESVQSQTKWLGYIQYQLDRLVNLTDNILLKEQLDFYKQHTKEKFNLSSLLLWHIKSLKALVNEKNISINKNIEGNAYIYADKELITRLISILTDNAIKYTNENGTINISIHQSKKNIFLSVINTGVGIEPEYIDRIFDRFYRINRAKSRCERGNGLGLSIAKSIVKDIKGAKISVESTVGEKTTFYLTLPKVE